jgi:PAS domain S-box-containing protein
MTEARKPPDEALQQVISTLREEVRELRRRLADDRRGQRDLGHLAAIVASSQDAIVSKNLDGRIESWNAAAERLFGYSAAEAIGQPITMIIPPERLAEEERIIATLKRGERIEHFLTTRIAKDGRRIEVLLTISPIRSAAGEVIGASKIARDITGLRLTEAQLRRQEQAIARLDGLIELAFEAIMVWDWNDGLVLWNRGCEQIYGFARAEALGRVTHELLRTRFPQSLRAAEEELLAEGSWAGELRHRARDGREITVDSRMQLVTFEGRKLVLESNRDITDKVRAEQALRASEQRYRQTLEALPQLVWTAHADGAVDYVSRQWLDYTGTTLEQNLADRWSERIPLSDRERVLTLWKHCVRRRQVYDAEVRLCAADGRYRWFKQRAVPLRGPTSPVEKWFGTCTDITDLIEARDIIRAANADLEQRVSERTLQLQEANSELQAFAHSVAHDLRAPLRNIQGYATALLEDEQGRLSEEGALYTRRLAQGAVRLDGLIQDLLAYNRLSRAEIALERVDLDLLLKTALEELSPEIAAREADVSVAADLGVVCGNRTVLGQAVSNLISNALKFVPHDAAPRVRIFSQRADGRVRLTVADQGIGIAPEHQERIFRVFERLHGNETYPGTGIGLAIVRRGVARLGGHVELESAPGSGSRFTIDLPASPEEGCRRPPAGASPAP